MSKYVLAKFNIGNAFWDCPHTREELEVHKQTLKDLLCCFDFSKTLL